MDNLTSYRLTLFFIFAIVAPSTLLSFLCLSLVANERKIAESRLEARFRGEGRDLVQEIERKLDEARAELDRALAEAAGRARAIRDVAGTVRGLAGAGRTFRASVLVDAGGALLAEGGGSASPAGGGGGGAGGGGSPPGLDGSSAPRSLPLEEIFRTAEDLEFRAGDLKGALQRISEIERAHADDDSVRAEALAARARLYGRLETFLDNVFENYRQIVTRYPLARDRDGTVLSLGARLEMAAIFRRWGADDNAARTLEDLVRFIARHEDELRAAQASWYRDQAIARLREIDPALADRAAKAAEAARRDREAARAFAASLKGPALQKFRQPLDAVGAAGRGVEPALSGWLRPEPGRPAVFYRVFLAPAGPGSPPRPSALGLAAFEVDWEGLRAREFEPIVERAGAHDDGSFALRARAEAAAAAPEDEIWRQTLRFPLDDLELAALRREPIAQDTLTRISENVRFWAIGLALIGLAAGAFVMTRAVRKEMKVAELKSDFVTTVTHELKTPLTSIGMFAETLLMGRVKDEDEKRECLEIIAKETDRLSRLIDRVLTFSKIEARKKRFDLKLTDLQALVDETVELFKTQMRGAPKPFAIAISIIHDMPPILMDRGSIQEVLLNLLSNAYKYGGEQKRIEVTVSKRRRWAGVEVRDWGLGIPRNEQRKIFHKFYRSNDLLTREVEGTGIGLTLALSIAHAHRGDITVRSKVGAGAAFTLWLPW